MRHLTRLASSVLLCLVAPVAWGIGVSDHDFGDAPASYGTLLADDGARHRQDQGAFLFLGSGVDAESDGLPTADALGDDNNGLDDEDGVVFTSLLVAGGLATLDITASAGGFLSAWLDQNGDGSWGLSDQIFDDQALAAGVNSLNFLLSPAALPGNTYARFRFASATGLLPTGGTPDGEVEDYRVTIQAAQVPTPAPLALLGGALLLLALRRR